MDRDKLEYFRKRLLMMREELIQKAASTLNTELRSTGKGDGLDFADLAGHETDRNFMLRVRDRERKLIAKIDSALERIADGTYGICDECGCGISERRLEARPVATLCIDCKNEQERMEKISGG